MRSLVHFAIVAGLTIASIAGASWVLDLMGVPQVPGFGWDDILLGTVAAVGVTLGTSLVRGVMKAA